MKTDMEKRVKLMTEPRLLNVMLHGVKHLNIVIFEKKTTCDAGEPVIRGQYGKVPFFLVLKVEPKWSNSEVNWQVRAVEQGKEVWNMVFSFSNKGERLTLIRGTDIEDAVENNSWSDYYTCPLPQDKGGWRIKFDYMMIGPRFIKD